LPFVDEQRLQKAIGPLLDDLTEDESIYMSITFHVKFCKITFFFQNKEIHLGRISTLSVDTIKAMTSCEVRPRLHPTEMHPIHSSQNVKTTI
jgi:hypothetical protein